MSIRLIVAACALLLVAVAPRAGAQARPETAQARPETAQARPEKRAQARAERLEVRVHVICASNDGDFVDPRLEDLKRQLEAFAFSSFKLLDVQSRTLAIGKTGTIDLPGDRVLTIVPQQRDDEGRLRLRLTIGEIIDTTYTIAEGATLIVGGPRHAGGHLVLAVNQNAER